MWGLWGVLGGRARPHLHPRGLRPVGVPFPGGTRRALRGSQPRCERMEGRVRAEGETAAQAQPERRRGRVAQTALPCQTDRADPHRAALFFIWRNLPSTGLPFSSPSR